MNKVICGNALEVLPMIAPGTFYCCITSPPYWGLRSYGEGAEMVFGGEKDCKHEWGDFTTKPRKRTGHSQAVHKDGYADAFRNSPRYVDHVADETPASGSFCQMCGAWRGQFGLEPTPEMYVEHTLEFLRAIRRVLRDDGCVWWNLGDSYNSASGGYYPCGSFDRPSRGAQRRGRQPVRTNTLKTKDLVMIPFRVALAAQADGWWVRSVIIWNKPNPMPESVRDRPTTSHEYVLLLTKSARYFYDADAIREVGPEWTGQAGTFARSDGKATSLEVPGQSHVSHRADRNDRVPTGRNKRSVWTVTTKPYPEAHFATFPPDLIKPMILTTPTKCCAECGAGWERVMEVYGGTIGKAWHDHVDDGVRGQRTVNEASRGHGYTRNTLGFRPTCSCLGEPEYEMVTCPSCKGSGVTEQRDGSEKRCGRCRGKTNVRAFAYNGFGFPAEVLDKWPTKPATVLDLFAGTGTVGQVAEEHGRDFTLIELVSEYIPLIKKRLSLAAPKEIKTPKTKGRVVIQTALPFEDGFEIIDDSTER